MRAALLLGVVLSCSGDPGPARENVGRVMEALTACGSVTLTVPYGTSTASVNEGQTYQFIVPSSVPAFQPNSSTLAFGSFSGSTFTASDTCSYSDVSGAFLSCTGGETPGSGIYVSALEFTISVSDFTESVTVSYTDDDDNPCTLDACNGGNVSHGNAPAGYVCGSYGSPSVAACHAPQACDGAGTCVNGNAKPNGTICSGGTTCLPNVCTNGTCSAATGSEIPAAGTRCGTACDGKTCDGAGNCSSGAAPPTGSGVDGNSCDTTTCDPVLGLQTTSSCTPTVTPPPSSDDTTVPTSISDGSQFLYSGANPVQTGVTPGVIDPTRVAVIRGRVLQSDGVTPFQGVTCTADSGGVFGQTLTRADGRFDLAVNGGATYAVVCEPQPIGPCLTDAGPSEYCGFPIQRNVQPRPLDYAILPDMVLTELDPTRTVIVLSSPVWQAHTASVSSDSDGSRQARVLFPPGTQATLVGLNGNQSTSTLTVHATEFTVGDAGAKKMPVPLPANSGYTYFVDFFADEQVAPNAVDVLFTNTDPQYNNSVFFYVDDFIGFPTNGGSPGLDGGTVVPAGFIPNTNNNFLLDPWIASSVPGEAAQVITITAINCVLGTGVGCVATVNPVPTGMTAGELGELGQLYAGATLPKSLWRVPMTHFSFWDMNWGYGPRIGAIPPMQPQPNGDGNLPKPCLQENASTIECENQILREDIPIVGTPYSLHYQGDRQQGRAVTLDIPVSLPTLQAQGGTTAPWGGTTVVNGNTVTVPTPDKIYVTITVAGRSFTYLPTVALNQSIRWNWDKKDAYGRYVSGEVTAHIGVGYAYAGSSSYLNTPAFGYNGGGTITGNRALREVVLWQYHDVPVGDFDNKGLGLGGWSLSANHLYEPSERTFLAGDGRRRTVSSEGAIITTADSTPNYAPAVGVAVAPDGTVYWSDEFSIHQLARTGVSTVFAGNYPYNQACANGTPAASCTMSPYGLALGPDGTLYFADQYNNLVRKIDPSPPHYVTTVAGTGAQALRPLRLGRAPQRARVHDPPVERRGVPLRDRSPRKRAARRRRERQRPAADRLRRVRSAHDRQRLEVWVVLRLRAESSVSAVRVRGRDLGQLDEPR